MPDFTTRPEPASITTDHAIDLEAEAIKLFDIETAEFANGPAAILMGASEAIAAQTWDNVPEAIRETYRTSVKLGVRK